MLLIDSAGNVRGSDQQFRSLFGVAAAVPLDDALIETVFPRAFRPRDLLASSASQNSTPCLLTATDGTPIPASLRIDSIGADWLLAIHLNGAPSPPAELGFVSDQLRDRQETRGDIARYLHDTVCQNLVALSLSLARLERDPALSSLPGVVSAANLCNSTSRDIRVLINTLSPPVADGAEAGENDLDAVASLRWYTEHLKNDAGLNVLFEADATYGADSNVLDPFARTLLSAALQRWAEACVNQPGAVRQFAPTTRISMFRTARGSGLQFLTAREGDPPIAAVLASSLISESARASGGSLEPTAGHRGSSARLSIGMERG